MMQKLKVFVLVFTMLLGTLCTMTACSIAGDNSPKGAKDSQIEADIKVLESVQNGVINGYFMPVEKYELLDFSIIKRQTNLDKKEDIVFLSVVIANSYVKTTLEYTFKYEYYDQGGWLLDNTQLTSKYSVPLKGVTESLVCGGDACYKNTSADFIAACDFVPSKMRPIEHQTNLESETDLIVFAYADHHYEMTGYEMFTFDQSYGWVSDDKYGSKNEEDGRITVTIENINIDWDAALKGLFAYEKRPNECYVRLYNKQGNKVSVDFYHEYTPNIQYTYANNVIGTIDTSIYSLSFTTSHYYTFSYSNNPYSEREITLFYDFFSDTWRASLRVTYPEYSRVE